MANSISRSLINIDKISDDIPVVSTITNLINIFLKCVYLPWKSERAIRMNRYLTHIQEKSFLHCVVLLIPFIGNFLVRTWNFADKNYMLRAVRYDGHILQEASEELKDDMDLVLAAVRRRGTAIRYASDRLRHNKNIALVAVHASRSGFEELSDELKNDRDILLAAIQNNIFIVAYDDYITEELKNDRDFMLEAIQRNYLADFFLSDQLRNDREFVLALVQRNGILLRCIFNPEFRNDREIVLAATQQNPAAIQYASQELRNELAVV